MTDERADLMLEILKSIQGDVSKLKAELTSQSERLAVLDDYCQGSLSALYERQVGIARDTEH